MRPLGWIGAGALLPAALLLLGEAAPLCRNYRGTSRDSGYPCRIERSSGITEYLFSADASLGVPYPLVLAAVLGAGGVLAIARGRG